MHVFQTLVYRGLPITQIVGKNRGELMTDHFITLNGEACQRIGHYCVGIVITDCFALNVDLDYAIGG